MNADDPTRAHPGAAVPEIAGDPSGATGGTASTPERKQAWDVFHGKQAARLLEWSIEEIVEQAEKEIPGGTTPVERRLLREDLARAGTAPAVRRTPGPIATEAQAHDAYRRLLSERKAASELGISRTQLRRLLGRTE